MTFGSNRRADRTNRWVLSILGVVLVATAIVVLTVSLLPSTRDEAVLPATDRGWLLDNGSWLAILVMLLAAVGGWLCLRWLRRQLVPIPGRSAMQVQRSELGTTTVQTSALTDAIEAELLDVAGVTDATAHVRDATPDTIDVLVDVDDAVHLDELVDDADRIVLAHARRATGREHLTLAIECRPRASAAPPRAR